MSQNGRQLLAAVGRLMRDMRLADNRDERFEMIEKLAIIQEVAGSLAKYEQKLIAELDVD
jgi:hypothetical protein